MKKYILSLLILQTVNLFAQNYVPDITERYWNYRYHLIGDDIDPTWEAGLLQMGDCDGCSLPATQAVMTGCWNDNDIYRFPNGNQNPGDGHNCYKIKK